MEELEERVDKLCAEARSILVNKWIPSCAEVFHQLKHCWSYLVPKKSGESFQIVEKLFTSVCALMSLQLRSLVMKSLQHFRDIITHYEVRGSLNKKLVYRNSS